MKIDKDAKFITEAYFKVINESLYGKLSNQFQKWGIGEPGNENEGKPGYWTQVTPREEELLNYFEQENEKRDKEMEEAEAAGRQLWISKYPETYAYLKQIGATEKQLQQRWQEIKDGAHADLWEQPTLTGNRVPTPMEYYKNYAKVNDELATAKERRKNGYYDQYEEPEADNKHVGNLYTKNAQQNHSEIVTTINDNLEDPISTIANKLDSAIVKSKETTNLSKHDQSLMDYVLGDLIKTVETSKEIKLDKVKRDALVKELKGMYFTSEK